MAFISLDVVLVEVDGHGDVGGAEKSSTVEKTSWLCLNLL